MEPSAASAGRRAPRPSSPRADDNTGRRANRIQPDPAPDGAFRHECRTTGASPIVAAGRRQHRTTGQPDPALGGATTGSGTRGAPAHHLPQRARPGPPSADASRTPRSADATHPAHHRPPTRPNAHHRPPTRPAHHRPPGTPLSATRAPALQTFEMTRARRRLRGIGLVLSQSRRAGDQETGDRRRVAERQTALSDSPLSTLRLCAAWSVTEGHSMSALHSPFWAAPQRRARWRYFCWAALTLSALPLQVESASDCSARP